ncbi:MAG: hypothetical protein OHK0039_39580 [Bacteroidia bacterium]
MRSPDPHPLHMSLRYVLSLCLLLWIPMLMAQDTLLLRHRHSDRQVIYLPGDWIRLACCEESLHYHGYFERIEDSTIVLVHTVSMGSGSPEDSMVVRDAIPLADVSSIYLPGRDRRAGRHIYAGATLTTGSIMVVADVMEVVVNQGKPALDRLVLTTTIMLSGVLVRSLGRDVCKIGPRWELTGWNAQPYPLPTYP